MRLILATVLFVTCLGCATVGKEVQSDKIDKIKKGVTTEQEVIELLGNPQTKTMGSDGKVLMLYQYAKVKNRAINFIPVANLLAGGMDMRMQMLTIIIGHDSKVENYTLNDSNTDINSGLLNT